MLRVQGGFGRAQVRYAQGWMRLGWLDCRPLGLLHSLPWGPNDPYK